MHQLILILLLFAPQDHDVGVRIGADLTAAFGDHARVLLGKDAIAELAKRGLKDADLASSPEVGEALTRTAPEVVLVRLDCRVTGGDQVIESAVWDHGRLDRHVSIAGGGHSATDGASHGICDALSGMISAASDDDADAGRLPQLVHAEDWLGVLALVDPFGPPPAQQDVHSLYYGVLANVRLGREAHAREILARMRAQHPSHVLTGAAGALLPAEPAPDAAAPTGR